MIKIHIVVDSLKWKKKIKDIESYFKLKQKKFNTFFNSSKKINEFTIFLTSNVKMKNLNNKFVQTRSQLEVKEININLLMCF